MGLCNDKNICFKVKSKRKSGSIYGAKATFKTCGIGKFFFLNNLCDGHLYKSGWLTVRIILI